MSIQLLKDTKIGGAYRLTGEIIESLSSKAESMFVNRGDAVYLPDLDQSEAFGVGNSLGTLTTVQTAYNMSNTGTNNVTRHSAYIFKGLYFDGLYIRVFNDFTDPVEYHVCVLTSSVVGDGLYSASPNWVDVPYQGAATGMVPAGEYLDFGPVTLKSASYGTGTILAIRTNAADNTSSIGTPSAEGTNLLAQTFFSCRQNGVDAATKATASLLVSPVFAENLTPAMPIFISSQKVRRFAIIAGSVQSGIGDHIQLGHWWQAQQELCDMGLPTVFANYCVGSRSTAASLALALELIASGDSFTDMGLLTSSGDDSGDPDFGTPAYVVRMEMYWDIFIGACRAAGIRPWLIETTFATAYPDPQYSTRRDCNRAARIKCGQDPITGVPNGTEAKAGNFQFGIWFSNEAASVGEWLVPSNTIDQTHFSQTGITNAKSHIVSTIRNPLSLTV